MNITDADLVPRCRAGDEAAWRELVARHTRKVFGLAYRFTSRVDEAEDLTQEVFVKVYQTLGRYREGDGPFGGWLMAVARNHVIDHYRRGRQERLRRVTDPAIVESMPARQVAGWKKLEMGEHLSPGHHVSHEAKHMVQARTGILEAAVSLPPEYLLEVPAEPPPAEALGAQVQRLIQEPVSLGGLEEMAGGAAPGADVGSVP